MTHPYPLRGDAHRALHRSGHDCDDALEPHELSTVHVGRVVERLDLGALVGDPCQKPRHRPGVLEIELLDEVAPREERLLAPVANEVGLVCSRQTGTLLIFWLR